MWLRLRDVWKPVGIKLCLFRLLYFCFARVRLPFAICNQLLLLLFRYFLKLLYVAHVQELTRRDCLRLQVCYGLLNIAAASGIVFANKAVMTTFGFKFIYALTLIHTITTLFGMKAFAAFGMFEPKALPKLSIAPLAGSYVGYIVLNNLNLQLNTVGFYQISKIAVAPAVRCLVRRNSWQPH